MTRHLRITGEKIDREARKEASTGGIPVFICKAIAHQMIPPILFPKRFAPKCVQLTKAKRRKFRD